VDDVQRERLTRQRDKVLFAEYDNGGNLFTPGVSIASPTKPRGYSVVVGE
jgi:hypothetical protein